MLASLPGVVKLLVNDHGVDILLLAVGPGLEPARLGDQSDAREAEAVPDGEGSDVG